MIKIQSKKNLIILGTFILIIFGVFMIRPILSSICTKYNTSGVRSGDCVESAPFFCKKVYYQPSCKNCQDAEGCGF